MSANDELRCWPQLSCELGESLIWDGDAGVFWWVDVHAGTLFRCAPKDAEPDRWQFAEAIGHVALSESANCVVLGLASGLVRFDWQRVTTTRIVDVPHAAPAMRLNDGRCDRAGNLVFGTMSEGGRGPRGAFWRYGAAHGLQRLDLPPPAIPNSICFSPDGGRLYYTDSLARAIMVCDYDAVSGAVADLRVFADPGAVAWEPDGSCVDAEGGLWNARWGGSEIVRYHPDGTLERSIACTARQPTCPCLAGERLDTLYVTSARIGLAAGQAGASDGGILCWPPGDGSAAGGVRGLPEGRVRGL